MAITDINRWAASRAAELRLAQGALENETVTQRREYLVTEIRKAMQAIPSSEKEQHLQALAVYFPDFGETRTQVERVVEVRQASLDEASPEALLDALLKKVPLLSAQQKQQFIKRIDEAGLTAAKPPVIRAAPAAPPPPPAQTITVTASGGNVPVPEDDAESKVRTKLGVGAEVNAERVVILAAELMSAFERGNGSLWHFVQDKGTLNLGARVAREHGSIELIAREFLRTGSKKDLKQMCDAEGRIGAVIVETVNDFLSKFLEDVKTKFDPSIFQAKTPKKPWPSNWYESLWQIYSQTYEEDLAHTGPLKQEAFKTWAQGAHRMWRKPQ